MFKFFVTFDLKNAQGRYDDFYEQAQTLGLTKYIPADYSSNHEIINLPNTTLYGVISSDSSKNAKSLIIKKVESIYTYLNLQGRYSVIESNGSFTGEI